MNGIGLPAEPDWKRFLNLGQQLLEQPSSAGQTQLISNTISASLGCEAQVWLASPYYPLPGDPEMETLPRASASEPVFEAFSSHQMVTQIDQSGQISAVAIPLLAQDDLLGVVCAWSPSGSTFQAQDIEYLKGLAAHASLTMEFTRQVTLKNWRYEQLSLVRLVSDQVANVLDLDELCRRVAHLIQETFNYYYVGIFTLEESSSTLVLRAGASQIDSIFLQPGFVVKIDEGMIEFVALSGDEVVAPNVHEEPNYRYIDTLPHTQSEMAVPLKVENRLLGVLDVQSDKRDAFHEIDQLVLRSLANNVALAIEGIHLYSNLRHNNEQISSVIEISHAITSILDLDELLGEVVDLIQKRFGFPFVHIFTVHPGRGKVIYRRGSGARSQAMQENELQYELNDPKGIIPWVARTGKTKLTNNIEDEPLYRPSSLPPADTRSELTIPLKFAGDVLGVLDFQSLELNAFNGSDLEVFEVLGGSIAVAIRNASLYRSERWRRQVANSMRDVAGLISANLAIDTLLDRILTELERHLPCQASSIWLLDENYNGNGSRQGVPPLRLAAVHGLKDKDVLKAMQHPPVDAWMKQALELEETLDPQTARPIWTPWPGLEGSEGVFFDCRAAALGRPHHRFADPGASQHGPLRQRSRGHDYDLCQLRRCRRAKCPLTGRRANSSLGLNCSAASFRGQPGQRYGRRPARYDDAPDAFAGWREKVRYLPVGRHQPGLCAQILVWLRSPALFLILR